jgi:ketosteroid isomerase-like protein
MARARFVRKGDGSFISRSRDTSPELGDVVVLHGRYEAVIESDGQERTMRGRLTEMFVRRDGKWVHPGWHLDLTPGPAPSQ